MITLTKVDAACHLLDAGITRFLAEDFISAAVLVGSAEIVLGNSVAKTGLAPSIDILKKTVQFVDGKVGPKPPTTTEDQAFKQMRSMFNWLRHANRDEPHTRLFDLEAEAAFTLSRALGNYLMMTGHNHPRLGELAQRYPAA